MNQKWDARIEGNENIKWLNTIIYNIYSNVLNLFIFSYIYVYSINNK